MPEKETVRKYPVGAEVVKGGVHFRIWAPSKGNIEVVFFPKDNRQAEIPLPVHLKPEGDGYFSVLVENVPPGILYGFRFDEKDKIFPDPASRFQPSGPDGFSQVINPSEFKWTDNNREGIPSDRKIMYEMHIGTFTSEGTWNSACKFLPEISNCGFNIIELMPVADFEGKFGWGYDGVNLFAPTHLYGSPDDFRKFVDCAHSRGIAVILDVVYNHFGPGSSFLKEFSPHYFTKRYVNEWGEAINFDGESCGPVREYVLTNARYWIEEFHIDGLRLDATQQIFDSSKKHIIGELSDVIHGVTPEKRTAVIGENESQNVNLFSQCNIDALWNDDFHHTATVALTGHAEAYYSDYSGTPQEFISCAKYGYLYQGQYYTWQKKPRGTPSLCLSSDRFIHFLQNHDQIANTCRGLRIQKISGPGLYRAVTALLILGPQIPMLFQGQEFAASSPFYYFADHEIGLTESARLGRERFLSQFKSIESVKGPLVAAPGDPQSFVKCKLNQEERELNKEDYLFHKELFALRKSEPVFSEKQRKGIDGAVLSREAFVIRYFGIAPDFDRILVINLGCDVMLKPNPEPLLAHPFSKEWKLLWYSENPLYGGNGAPPLIQDGIWNIYGHCAFFLEA